MNQYERRDKELQRLGFNSYADYLSSALWLSIRHKVFKCKGRRCTLCGADANQIHHQRYDRADLIGNKIKYLHPICETCHKTIEFSDSGWKRDFSNVCKLFDDLLDRRLGRFSPKWAPPPNKPEVEIKKKKNAYRDNVGAWLNTRPKVAFQKPPKFGGFINLSRNSVPFGIMPNNEQAMSTKALRNKMMRAKKEAK